MTNEWDVKVLHYLIIHAAEAAPLGICRMLFGRDILFTSYPVYLIDPILFAYPCSSLALVFGSYMTRNKEVDVEVPVMETAE